MPLRRVASSPNRLNGTDDYLSRPSPGHQHSTVYADRGVGEKIPEHGAAAHRSAELLIVAQTQSNDAVTISVVSHNCRPALSRQRRIESEAELTEVLERRRTLQQRIESRLAQARRCRRDLSSDDLQSNTIHPLPAAVDGRDHQRAEDRFLARCNPDDPGRQFDV